jgi:hypothetical protein
VKRSQQQSEINLLSSTRGVAMKMASRFARYNKGLLTLAIVLPLLAILVLNTPAQAAPVITLTPASGAIGTRVSINGTNFDSYKGDRISISFDNTEITGSPLTVPDTGTFTTELNIPGDATPGRHYINVNTVTGTTTLLARTFFIVEETEITLDVTSGLVGTGVTINGWGFYAGRMINVFYYNVIGEKLGTEVASATGEFSYHFIIPSSTAGEHKITVTNAEGNSAEADFEVIPSITLNLASGSPGALLTVRGIGFGYRGEVDIIFGTYPVAKARTDEYGNFEVAFNVPKMKPNIYDVKALDEYKNADKAKFTTTAGASLNQTEGSVSSGLTVRGNGFKTRETVTIDYDDLRIATATTDNYGDFSATFNIPPSSGGDHVITVSDGQTTKRLAFTVETEAPPVPGLLLPADSVETRARAYLDWQNVTDPSPPVTYRLQVTSDRSFTPLILEKEGLTDSEYSLSEEEALPAVRQAALYYWRVKAIDGASNESEWSETWSFYVSAPPVPALVLPVFGSKAETPVLLSWQAVTSLSPPVTYRLQVATDQNFTSLMLEEEGLTNHEYTSEEEALPAVRQEAPYYWRVKAVDSAGNESEWSEPWSFYVGFVFALPGWAKYTLIGIGVIVVGFLTFWVGRRTAFSSPG